jgi:molecular chaperone DnaK
MKSAVDVDDAAVQQMVEESVEHAFEDLAARRWIEAKLKANAILAATRRAVADCGEEIEPGYREQIEAAARQVEDVLQTEDPATGSGDLKRLQAAIAALDEATVPLADLMMEKATEALLRKKGLV